MGPKTKELIDVLGELEQLLRRADEAHWSVWVAQARREILASDFHGVQRLLDSYGGAGSFNDVVVFFVSGVSSVDFVETPENDRFALLRARAFELASELKREGSG